MKKVTRILLVFGSLFMFVNFSILLPRPTAACGLGNLEGTPTPTPPYMLLGDAYFDASMIDEAIEQYKAAIALDPGNSDAILRLQNAISQMSKVAAEVSYFDIGDVYLEAKMTNTAIGYYIKGLEADPSNTAGLEKLSGAIGELSLYDPKVILAEQYAASGNLEKAIELYSEVLETNPDNLDAIESAKNSIAQSNNEIRNVLLEIRNLLMEVSPWLITISVLLMTALILQPVILWIRNEPVTRWIRKNILNKKLQPEKLTYVVNPFNSTMPSGRGCIENAVHNIFIEEAFRSGGAAKTQIDTDVPELPELGVMGFSLIQWLLGFVVPPPYFITIDGTLIGEHMHAYEDVRGELKEEVNAIGLTLRKKDPKASPTTIVKTFRYPEPGSEDASSSDSYDVGDYLTLARRAAVWATTTVDTKLPVAKLVSRAGQMLNEGKADEANELMASAVIKEGEINKQLEMNNIPAQDELIKLFKTDKYTKVFNKQIEKPDGI